MAIEFVWHARRFWIQEPLGFEHAGWNTRFEPCFITGRTSRRVQILSPTLGKMYLNREVLERDGRVYHSKPHEWFYKVKPAVDSERYSPLDDIIARIRGNSPVLAILGLQPGATQPEIKRAYKRLAAKAHPDGGGSHEAFIRLQAAYELAMRFA